MMLPKEKKKENADSHYNYEIWIIGDKFNVLKLFVALYLDLILRNINP